MWKKIKIEDQWGHLEYTFTNGKEVSLTSKDKIKVKWPNKEETEERLTEKVIYTEVSDHGKEYSIASTLLVIKTKFRGIPVDVTLDKVKVWF